jgi:hypothetical protein
MTVLLLLLPSWRITRFSCREEEYVIICDDIVDSKDNELNKQYLFVRHTENFIYRLIYSNAYPLINLFLDIE